MKNGIKILIAVCVVLIGIYVWYAPHGVFPPAVPREAAFRGNVTEVADVPEMAGVPEMADVPEITEELKQDMYAGYLILVNKSHEISADYKPDDLQSVLYYADGRSPEGRYLRAEAGGAFHRLVEEAAKQDVVLAMTTAYRSYGFQSILYNNYVEQDGQEAADMYSAAPGKSEHQTGLAVDVSAPSVDFRLEEAFADTKEGRWLAENAHLFGFIVRYPAGKEGITGYLYEPWHIRYVGLPAAAYIFAHEITFEEYLKLVEKDAEE